MEKLPPSKKSCQATDQPLSPLAIFDDNELGEENPKIAILVAAAR